MGRLKLLVSLALFFLFLISTSGLAYASLVTIDKEGKVTINVLSAEESIELEIPRKEFLEVKDIAKGTPDPEAKISLAKIDGKIKLNVSTSSGEKSLDVTNYKEEIIEIEERSEVERVTISVKAGKFTIEQKGVVAETDFAISINPRTARLALITSSGHRFLSILPRQATEIVLRSKYINRIGRQDRLVISEQGRELSYEVAGDRVINLFNIFEYNVPVSAHISASTGEILSINQPTWLKVLGFLFV